MAQPKANITKSAAAAKANIKIGDLVLFKDTDNQGIITEICGKKWLKVVWSYGCIYDEHVNDLVITQKKRK